MKTSTLLSYCLVVFLSTVITIENANALEQNDKLFLQRLLNSDLLMAKRRAARELLGKRDGSDYYGRNVRRAKELFGKRSVPVEGYDNKLNVPEWLTVMKNQENPEFSNFQPHEMNKDEIAYLVNALINRRERRARSNELLG